MATWAIGDVHGCYRTLRKLLKKIEFAKSARPPLVHRRSGQPRSALARGPRVGRRSRLADRVGARQPRSASAGGRLRRRRRAAARHPPSDPEVEPPGAADRLVAPPAARRRHARPGSWSTPGSCRSGRWRRRCRSPPASKARLRGEGAAQLLAALRQKGAKSERGERRGARAARPRAGAHRARRRRASVASSPARRKRLRRVACPGSRSPAG